MTTTEFFKSKNKILRETLGLDFDLVPESQMVDVPFVELSTESGAHSCPYCMVFLKLDKICDYCPMAKAGNKCVHQSSTWTKYCDKIVSKSGSYMHFYERSKAYEPMVKLINEYNNSKGE